MTIELPPEEALARLIECRVLERWVAALEALPCSDPLRVLLPALRDRIGLLDCTLRLIDPVLRASLEDRLPPDIVSYDTNPPPPLVWAAESRRVH